MTPHRRSPGQPRVTPTGRLSLAAAGVLFGSVLLAGCGAQAPTSPQTTTITVTPTAGAGTTTASGTSTTTSTSSSSTTAAPTPPTTYADASSRIAKGTVDPAVHTTFTSPTGNIFCAISAAGRSPVGCELKQGRVAPTKAGSCPSGGPQDIGRIEFLANGPTPICNSDSIITGNVPTLKYGSVAMGDGSSIRCLSEKIGMTCVDTSAQHGFFITRSVYTLF